MPKTLQSEIRRLRKNKNLTQAQVADRMKLKRSSYAFKEAKGSFTEAELKPLAKILGVSPEELSTKRIGEVGLVKNPQEFIVNAAIRIESMNRAILRLLAEVVATQRGQSIESVLLELEEQVNSESLQTIQSL